MTKYLIEHGFDLSDPGQIALHKATIESRPIHGITVLLRGLSDQTLHPTASHTQAEYAAALAKMPTLTHCTHNFAIVRILHTFGFTDDAMWSRVAANFKALAAAAKAHGQFDGIFLDTEMYASETWPWKGTDIASAGKRGRQVGAAVASGWPGCQLLTTYGPWVGEPKTVPPAPGGNWGSFTYGDMSASNRLQGAFTAGLAAAAASTGLFTYVDGGEASYRPRTLADFQLAAKWMKAGMAASGSALITNPSTYSAHVSAAFGVYDRDERNGRVTATPAQWQSWLTNALKAADRYVWAYTEHYDWRDTGWPTTKVPAEIITATKNALIAAGATT